MEAGGVRKIDESVASYEINGHPIEVMLKEMAPAHEVPKEKAILFLTGWSAGNAKTLEYLSGRFAMDADERAIQVRTSYEGIRPEALMEEARAIQKVILERGLKEITLAAHSEGGTKAVNVINLLQEENPDVNVRGLILMDPMGLYEQESVALTKAFAQDSLVDTPMTMARNVVTGKTLLSKGLPIVRGLQASSDIIFNIMREMRAAKLDYPSKLRSQIAGMAKANKNYAEVRCPVVLIQGAYDLVSSSERVLPSEADPKTLSERSEILKKTFFPGSPRVDMLVPEKFGNHGIPHFRPEAISRASLYLLERQKRRERDARATGETP